MNKQASRRKKKTKFARWHSPTHDLSPDNNNTARNNRNNKMKSTINQPTPQPTTQQHGKKKNRKKKNLESEEWGVLFGKRVEGSVDTFLDLEVSVPTQKQQQQMGGRS